MKLGFTGTRQGMTPRQLEAFTEFLTKHQSEITEFHHGDCIGADAQAHAAATDVLGVEKIHVHPPDVDTHRAFCQSPHMHRPMGYLARDMNIVELTDRLVATPKAGPPRIRSGTWYTVRRAKERRKPVLILEA